jgi:hypothetical protein
MRLVLCLLWAAGLPAAESEDRTAIRTVVSALNALRDTPETTRAAALFASREAAEDWQCFAALERRLLPRAGPFPETTRPHLAVRSIRFVTPDAAAVFAASSQFGSTLPVRRLAALIVMRKGLSGWQVAALRVTAACAPSIPAVCPPWCDRIGDIWIH